MSLLILLGGSLSGPPPGPAGYRSMLAFWLGGAASLGGGPGPSIFVRRPNMMRVGSRGDWIFKTVN